MIKAVIFDMYETLITLYSSPVYFSAQMAEDAGISEDFFMKAWRATEEDRTIGRVTVDEVIENIMKSCDCFSEEKLELIMRKRIQYKRDVFEHMNPEIIPLLKSLREHGIKIGLISNCHSEEAMVIKQSILFPYFDVVCLSYDEGIQKPDESIFMRCLEKIRIDSSECLYVGDGGSHELETAGKVGMHPVQAVWYLKEGTMQPTGRMKEFTNIESPMQIMEEIKL